MDFKLRGTNIIGIELLADRGNFNAEAIKEFINTKRQLLKGARLIIAVEDYPMKREEIEEIYEGVKRAEGIFFCGFKSNVKENRELCISMGIPCDITTVAFDKREERSSVEEVRIIRKTLRSGDKEVSTGDIVVLGDVNPGAEIEAGGNVYVLGSLRGFVRAGIGKSRGEIKAMHFQAPRIELCGKGREFERNESYFNFKAFADGRDLKIEFLEKG